MLSEPPGADPHAGWCGGRRGELGAYPIHRAFYQALGYAPDFEDPSTHPLDVETQLGWSRDIGFIDVDCYRKWLEMGLLIGVK